MSHAEAGCFGLLPVFMVMSSTLAAVLQQAEKGFTVHAKRHMW